jgi:hypothetical protein
MFVDRLVVMIVGRTGSATLRAGALSTVPTWCSPPHAVDARQIAADVRSIGRSRYRCDRRHRSGAGARAGAAGLTVRSHGRARKPRSAGPGGDVVDAQATTPSAWRRSVDAGAYGTLLTCRFNRS